MVQFFRFGVAVAAGVVLLSSGAVAQDRMTPEILWGLHRVSGDGVSYNGRTFYYTSKITDWKSEKSQVHHYRVDAADGTQREWTTEAGKTNLQRYEKTWYANYENILYESNDSGSSWKEIYNGLQDAENVWVSPNGKMVAYSKDVLIKPSLGSDIYADLPNTTAKVYTDLMYRHWDTWEDGKFSHIFVADIKTGKVKDVMLDEPFDCPQKPFGGAEDLAWANDSHGFVYVCKKKTGKDYAQSTNTDLYFYNVEKGKTVNWTEGMAGYDQNPIFSRDGRYVAWLSMNRDGYEADKNDIIVMNLETKNKVNLTQSFDGTVDGFVWGYKDAKIYFNAPFEGTQQLFEISSPESEKALHHSEMLTKGKWDVTGILGQCGEDIIVTRCDMNHANEVYKVKPKYGDMIQLTHENDKVYQNLHMSETKLRAINTPDGSVLHAWVIYPPDFDPAKKYPTLLY